MGGVGTVQERRKFDDVLSFVFAGGTVVEAKGDEMTR